MTAGGIVLPDAEATAAVGAALAERLRPGDVVALEGPLGAGKTTLARGLLAALGLEGEAPSPSFALVIEYPELRVPVAHVDLYRLEDAGELAELGLDEVLLAGALLVEWPGRAGPRAWPQALRLALMSEDVGRRLTWHASAAWEGRWPPAR